MYSEKKMPPSDCHRDGGLTESYNSMISNKLLSRNRVAIRKVLEDDEYILIEHRARSGQLMAVQDLGLYEGPSIKGDRLSALVEVAIGIPPERALDEAPSAVADWIVSCFAEERAKRAPRDTRQRSRGSRR